MKPPTTQSELTRNILALQAMDSALWFLKLISAETDSESVFKLYGGLCVFYARPFTNSHGFDRIEPSILVSNNLSDVHATLMEHRNELIAHSDSKHISAGAKINQAYVRVDAHGIYIENRHISPSQQQLNRIKQLIVHIRNAISSSTTSFLEQSTEQFFPNGLQPGLYQVNTNTDAQTWLEAVPDDGLAR